MQANHYENFNKLPRKLTHLKVENEHATVLAYFDEDYEGSVMVIDGSRLLAIMPDVQQGLLVAEHLTISTKMKQTIEILPSEAQHITHDTFNSWLSEVTQYKPEL